MFTKISFEGPECTTCCMVNKVCECEVMECLSDYLERALNESIRGGGTFQYSPAEVMAAGMKLLGFAWLGTYYRPVYQTDGGDVEVNDFGRSLIRSMIQSYGLTGAEVTKLAQWWVGIFDFSNYPGLGRCDACKRVECEAVQGLMKTLRDWLSASANPSFMGTVDQFVRPDLCCEGAVDPRYFRDCPPPPP